MSSFKPKFFLNGLPRNNKPDLSHNVVEPPNLEFPNHTEGNFCRIIEKPEDVKRHDRRVFVKVDESRTPGEWVQYAICHGFTDHKFLPEILKGFEGKDKLVVESTNVPNPAQTDQNDVVNSENLAPKDMAKVAPKDKPSFEGKDKLVVRSTNVFSAPQPDQKVTANAENVAPKDKPKVASKDKLNANVNANVMDLSVDDKDALFFELVKAEFRQLDCNNQRHFKKGVMELLFC